MCHSGTVCNADGSARRGLLINGCRPIYDNKDAKKGGQELLCGAIKHNNDPAFFVDADILHS